MKIAKSIRQKRENFLNKPEIYSQYEKEQLRIKELGEQCFIEYFTKLANKRKASNYNNWISALNYLETFTNSSLKFADLNQKFLEDFKEYLLNTKSNRSNKTTLSRNSAVSYFNKVKAALKQAYKEGILQTDLNAKIKPIKEVETRREYLTLDELNKLAKTDCNIDRATRLLYYQIYDRKTKESATNFLQKCVTFFPFKISKILTDNGLEFTNRMLIKKNTKEPVAWFTEKRVKS